MSRFRRQIETWTFDEVMMDYAVRVFEFRSGAEFLTAVVSADSGEDAVAKANLPRGFLDSVKAWQVDSRTASELIASGAEDLRP